MIKFSCHQCGNIFKCPMEWAGKRARCNSCNTSVVIPIQQISPPPIPPPIVSRKTTTEYDFIQKEKPKPKRVINKKITSPDNVSIKMWIGFVGSIMTILGVFCPMVRLPILGSISYFANGHGDGVIVLFLMLISLILITVQLFPGLTITSLITVGCLTYTYVGFYNLVNEAKQDHNVFSNIFSNMVQIDWGFGVIFVGSVIVFIAGVIPPFNVKMKKVHSRLPDNTLNYSVTGIVFLILCLIVFIVVRKSGGLSQGNEKSIAQNLNTLPMLPFATQENDKINKEAKSSDKKFVGLGESIVIDQVKITPKRILLGKKRGTDSSGFEHKEVEKENVLSLIYEIQNISKGQVFDAYGSARVKDDFENEMKEIEDFGPQGSEILKELKPGDTATIILCVQPKVLNATLFDWDIYQTCNNKEEGGGISRWYFQCKMTPN